MLLGIGAIELTRRHVDVDNPWVAVRALSVLNAFTIAGVVIFAVTGNFSLEIAAYLVYQVVRGAGGQIRRAWINRQLESNVRATIFSMHAHRPPGRETARSEVAPSPSPQVIGQLAL